METTFIQFRANALLKQQAQKICDELGIDLPTYLRMSMARLVRENGVPFSMTIDNPGLSALIECGKQAKAAGASDMTLDEINAEIDAARRGE